MQAGSHRTWVPPVQPADAISPGALIKTFYKFRYLNAVSCCFGQTLAHALYTWENQFHETHMIRWRARNKRISLADGVTKPQKKTICVFSLFLILFPGEIFSALCSINTGIAFRWYRVCSERISSFCINIIISLVRKPHLFESRL